MKAAVIGLGVEGKKAVKSFLKHGWEVYATDLNSNIDLSDLELPIAPIDLINYKLNPEYLRKCRCAGIHA